MNASSQKGEATPVDVDALRQGVMGEIVLEEENLSLTCRHGDRSKRLAPLLIGVLVTNALLFVTLPHYPVYWIIAGFLLYMLYFIVLMMPTTRRLRTPAEKKRGLKARPWPKMGRGIRGVLLRGKRAVVIAFWNTFFIGTQTMAKGMSLILAVSIAFALLTFAMGTLDAFSAAIITIQALAIMGYYYVIIRFRPYTKGFLRTMSRVKRNREAEFQWQAYFKGVLAVLIVLTVLTVFVISAVLLPGQSLQAVLGHIGNDLALAAVGLIMVFVSQFVIIRYVQGFESARVTTCFIQAKLAFLRGDIMDGIAKAERSGGAGLPARLHELQTKYRVSRIYKVAYKDILGILPTYPLIVDFRSILEEGVAEALHEEIPLDIPQGMPRE